MIANLESENNIIKHIAKEICRECQNVGYVATQELAEYIVRMKLLNPDNGYTAEHVMPRDQTQILINDCIQLVKQSTPATDGIRLQIYWNFNPVQFSRQDYNKMAWKNSEALLKDILESKFQIQDQDKILKKLASFIILYSGVGNPSDPLAHKETKAALQSILKTSNLQTFIASDNKDKISQLEYLTRIVVGIRLYHSYYGLAKETIEDVPKTLLEGVENFQIKIENCLENSETRINYITEGLKTLSIMNGNAEIGEGSLLATFDKNHLEISKDVLIIMLQYRIYIQQLLEKLTEKKEEIIEVKEKCEERLLRLGETIKNRIAIPTCSVFPLFTELGNLWVELQIKTHYFILLDSVITNLNSINKYFEASPFEKALNVLASIESKTINLQDNEIEKTEDMDPEVSVLRPGKHFQIQFGGFCAWTLSETQGIPIPGNPQIGFLEFQQKIYSFSSAKAARNWAKQPEKHIKKALNAARLKPTLVQLLQVYPQLKAYENEPLVEKVAEKRETTDREIQTEIHPIKKHYDKDYTFSIWELKRRALQLSRITKCETKSLQTVNHSSLRGSLGIQTAQNKDRISQTTKEAGSLGLPTSSYIWGLRGQKQEKPSNLRLVSENFLCRQK